ncbi:MAG TPA: hypothetical protein VKT25_05060 [Ktedonobacteraceae bacterium]|nr:hypothetical protein [Ktedonobacteraceae bacterium]
MSPDNSTGVATIGAGLAIFIALFSLAIFIFVIVVYWRIVSKAGYNGAMSLLLFIPIANIIMIIIFAFSEWPIQKELNQLRAMAARGSGANFPPQYPPQYGQPQQPQYGQQPPSQFGQPQYPQPPQYPQR